MQLLRIDHGEERQLLQVHELRIDFGMLVGPFQAAFEHHKGWGSLSLFGSKSHPFCKVREEDGGAQSRAESGSGLFYTLACVILYTCPRT